MLDWDLLDPQPDTCAKDIVALSKGPPAIYKALKESAKGSQPVLSCIYKANCTELFKAIDGKMWSDIVRFLDTSEWPGLSFSPDFPALQQTITVVSDKDEDSNATWTYLPVHMAILRGGPLDVVGRLVELAPKTLTVPDHDGNLALHLAMFMNARYDVQEFILSANPSVVSTVNRDGNTPLQCALDPSNKRALARGKILYTFMALGMAEPKELKAKEIDMFCDFNKNCSPLFRAIAEKDWSSVDLFLSHGRFCEASMMEVLWAAIFRNGKVDHCDPRDQVKTFVTKCGQYQKIAWAQLPIHLAIHLGAPLPVIGKLIELYPGSLAFPDVGGMLPLHLALQYNSKDEVVAFLLEKFPKAVQVPDLEGRSALEVALQGDNPLRGKFIKAFMEASKSTKEQRE